MLREDLLAKMRFQFITHFNEKFDYLASAKIALAGGCKWIQLRVKAEDGKCRSTSELFDLALDIKKICKINNACFIIDDDVNLVKEVGADGVHLGKNDMPIRSAREILGNDCIIGGTANTVEDVIHHVNSGADYIGMGPFRYTSTKRRISSFLGLQGYSKAISELNKRNINTPIIGIGGIQIDDIPEILNTGIYGIAVSGMLINSTTPELECMKVLEALSQKDKEINI